MRDIKTYKTEEHSLSNGQVLPRPYKYSEARLVFAEMAETLCMDMFAKNLVSSHFSWWASYDYKSMEAVPEYDGPLSIDFYGRIHPKHSAGRIRLPEASNAIRTVEGPLLTQFDAKTDHRLLYRKLGVCAGDVKEDIGSLCMNMFVDHEAQERDRRLLWAMLRVREKYGANALFKGRDLLEGATSIERNSQIGGHRA